jgi:translation initiation factor IF-2
MDTTDNKPKKLGLKLTGNLENKDFAKDYMSLKTTAPIVKTKNPVFEKTSSYSDANSVNLTNLEVSKRLDVLKKAAQDKEMRQDTRNDQPIQREVELADEKPKQIHQEPNLVQQEVVEQISPVIAQIPKVITTGVDKKTPESKPFIAKIVKDFEEPIPAAVAKSKLEAPKKLKKHDIYNLLENESGEDNFGRRRFNKGKKKIQQQDKVVRQIQVHGEMSVSELANKMSTRTVEVIKELMKLGVMCDANKILDVETIELLISTFGHEFEHVKEVTVNSMLETEIDDPKLLRPRPPIVTVMGHVDHGKTSLLDAIKSTDVALQEFGGITQNIGAYQVSLSGGQKITFIDTPGHEAFTAMRGRGAQITDMVILVVAIDDGINNQTVEAINHAKAANLPIIVAVNKIDKLDNYSNELSKIKNEMLMHNVISEDMGGDVMFIPVSALKKINLDKLEQAIILLAELMEIKANFDCPASGVVLDSMLDKHKGPISSLLVAKGMLKVGDFMVAGSSYGKIRIIQNDKAQEIKIAEPSTPVRVFGLDKITNAGDKFIILPSEKQAREMAENYSASFREKNLVSSAAVRNLLDPFSQEQQKQLLLVIKADSQGSLEAICGSLIKIQHPEVKLMILHKAAGGITESDVSLAAASKAMILAFNVRSSSHAASLAIKENISINYYSIIYDLLNDVTNIMNGMLAPKIREVYLGNVEIRQVFNITKVGKVAGCYVTQGIAKRGAGMRLLRDDVVIHEGKLKTLKRFKEDVKEVRENYECGIVFENYEDIKIGDKVEIFEYIEEKNQINNL